MLGPTPISSNVRSHFKNFAETLDGPCRLQYGWEEFLRTWLFGLEEPVSINPFDDESGSFSSRTATEGNSLWLYFADVSAGRRVVCSEPVRAACYIEQNWNDMRPRSLRERLAAEPGL